MPLDILGISNCWSTESGSTAGEVVRDDTSEEALVRYLCRIELSWYFADAAVASHISSASRCSISFAVVSIIFAVSFIAAGSMLPDQISSTSSTKGRNKLTHWSELMKLSM